MRILFETKECEDADEKDGRDGFDGGDGFCCRGRAGGGETWGKPEPMPGIYDDHQGVVWNFPAARKGHLELECYVAESGVQVTLTDHWYNACNEQAAKESPLTFALDKNLVAGEGRAPSRPRTGQSPSLPDPRTGQSPSLPDPRTGQSPSLPDPRTGQSPSLPKWSKIAVDWDLEAKTAIVSVDGKPAKTLALDAAPDFAPYGFSYLHLRTLAEATDPKGTYFMSFSMNVTR